MVPSGILDALKEGDLEHVVLVRPVATFMELNSSLLIDTEVLDEESKAHRQKRYGSAILKIRMIRFIRCSRFADMGSKDPRRCCLRIEAFVMRSIWIRVQSNVPHGNGRSPRSKWMQLMHSSRQNMLQEWFESRSRHARHQRFVCANPIGNGVWFMLPTS